MDSIRNLDKFKLNITSRGIKGKDGILENKSLSGKMYNIVTFIDNEYELKLTPLTREEVVQIKKDIMAKAKNSAYIQFERGWLNWIGFISTATSTNVNFSFSLDSLDIKEHEVAGLWELSLVVTEREMI